MPDYFLQTKFLCSSLGTNAAASFSLFLFRTYVKTKSQTRFFVLRRYSTLHDILGIVMFLLFHNDFSFNHIWGVSLNYQGLISSINYPQRDTDDLVQFSN